MSAKSLKIEKHLKQKINSGAVLAHQLLPSETKLAKQFSVSRETVRRALSRLAAEGYLYRRQGKGTYARDRSDRMTVHLSEAFGFTERMRQIQKEPATQVLRCERTEPTDAVKRILALKNSEKAWLIERLRLLDDRPLVFELSWMPERCVLQNKINELFASKYLYAKHYGFHLERLEKEYQAVLPSAAIQESLQLSPHMPVFQQTVIGHLADGYIFEYTKTLFNQNEFRFLETVSPPL